jgi:hypothetical protein
MKHLIIKGEPACLYQGYHTLLDNKVKKTVVTIGGTMERNFKLIDVEQYDPIKNEYNEMGKHWADCVTGSLYKPDTGECLTSYQLKMIV